MEYIPNDYVDSFQACTGVGAGRDFKEASFASELTWDALRAHYGVFPSFVARGLQLADERMPQAYGTSARSNRWCVKRAEVPETSA